MFIFSNELAQNFSNSAFIATINSDSFTLPCISTSLSMINIDLFTVRTALAPLSVVAGPVSLPALFLKNWPIK